jgi:hypothetical protein
MSDAPSGFFGHFPEKDVKRPFMVLFSAPGEI